MFADFYNDRALGVALMCTNICEQAGTLITTIISSWIVTSGVPWQTGLFAATVIAIVPLIALFCAKKHIRNVKKSENQRGLKRIFSNAVGIFSIKSYLLISAMTSLESLQMSAYTFWYPSVYLLAWTNVPNIFFGLSYTTITVINSVVMLTRTAIGLPTILWFAQSWRHGKGPFSGKKGNDRAYPIIVSLGAMMSAVLFVASVLLMDKSFPGS
ncbi:hypothetical protein PMAYCL1PPCAC_25398 [Pristionchus mayeri]|uniref:Membrane transporter n=1 Tax=Pristionchus mayeri TaxID=1317129 RepID=A0AAN5D281_9BILA|nr:hypothetical protein PMAYCL1PPCAC_25398 [Pristionchus mayeri]